MSATHSTDSGTPTGLGPASRTLARAAQTAMGAPSVFNTQPWRWVVRGDVAQLYADRTRQLPAVDPDGRLLTVSCGIALHHAMTTLAAFGHEAHVRRFPNPDEPDLLAEIRLSGDTQPDLHAVGQTYAMGARHTDRRPFSATPVSDETMQRLHDAARSHRAHLQILTADQVVELTVAATRAADVELTDPAYRQDLNIWSHRPADAGDGVPAATAEQVAGRQVPVRPFHLEELARSTSDGEPADRAARYALLFTDADDPSAWLGAGEALSEVLLTATAEGVAVSPMSDVGEVLITRHALRRILGGIGHPVLALRVGLAEPGAPAEISPRRGVEDVVTVESSGG